MQFNKFYTGFRSYGLSGDHSKAMEQRALDKPVPNVNFDDPAFYQDM
jgi:hypothetical protein